MKENFVLTFVIFMSTILLFKFLIFLLMLILRLQLWTKFKSSMQIKVIFQAFCCNSSPDICSQRLASGNTLGSINILARQFIFAVVCIMSSDIIIRLNWQGAHAHTNNFAIKKAAITPNRLKYLHLSLRSCGKINAAKKHQSRRLHKFLVDKNYK